MSVCSDCSSPEVARARSRCATSPILVKARMRCSASSTTSSTGLCRAWRCDHCRHRGPRIVAISENYDVLGYEPGAVTRDARYTRYVAPRRRCCAVTRRRWIPAALWRFARAGDRRRARSRVRAWCTAATRSTACTTGTPHQLDLWRVGRDRTLTTRRSQGDDRDRRRAPLLPGAEWRSRATRASVYDRRPAGRRRERRRVGRGRGVRVGGRRTCCARAGLGRRWRASRWASGSTGC